MKTLLKRPKVPRSHHRHSSSAGNMLVRLLPRLSRTRRVIGHRSASCHHRGYLRHAGTKPSSRLTSPLHRTTEPFLRFNSIEINSSNNEDKIENSPSLETYASKIIRYLRDDDLKRAYQLLRTESKRLQAISPDLFHPFLLHYSSKKDYKSFTEIFHRMEQVGIPDPTEELYSMVKIAIKGEKYEIATELITSMKRTEMDFSFIYNSALQYLLDTEKGEEAIQMISNIVWVPTFRISTKIASLIGKSFYFKYRSLIKFLLHPSFGDKRITIIWAVMRELTAFHRPWNNIQYLGLLILDKNIPIPDPLFVYLFNASAHLGRVDVIERYRRYLESFGGSLTEEMCLEIFEGLSHDSNKLYRFYRELREKDQLTLAIVIKLTRISGVIYAPELLDLLLEDLKKFPVSKEAYLEAFHAYFLFGKLSLGVKYILALHEQGESLPVSLAGFFAKRFPGTFTEFMEYQQPRLEEEESSPLTAEQQTKLCTILADLVPQ